MAVRQWPERGDCGNAPRLRRGELFATQSPIFLTQSVIPASQANIMTIASSPARDPILATLEVRSMSPRRH
jgi:hypothetical protein